jgi:hypothetical protein
MLSHRSTGGCGLAAGEPRGDVLEAGRHAFVSIGLLRGHRLRLLKDQIASVDRPRAATAGVR